MNRDAISIYLRDIRGLEVARYCITELYYERVNKKNKELKNLKKKGEKSLCSELKCYPTKSSKPVYELGIDLDPFLYSLQFVP